MVEAGVIAAWRRFWPTLTDQWGQFGVYVLIRTGLAVTVGILVSSVLGILFVPLFAVVGVTGLDPFGPLFGGSPALLALVLVPAAVVALVVSALVQVPIKSYLGYVALLVLGDSNPAFDLIPERRAEIRE